MNIMFPWVCLCVYVCACVASFAVLQIVLCLLVYSRDVSRITVSESR